MEAPHILILDEPTNHLDIDSRRALLDALNDYQGAVILITHDRSLMEMVADRLWLAADGSVKPYNGDMDDYAKLVLDRARVAARAPTQVARKKEEAPVAPPPPPRPTAAQAGPIRRKLEAAEVVLTRETKKLEEIDAVLAQPALYVKDPSKAADFGARRVKTQAAVNKAEAEWIALAEQLEQALG